MKKNYRLFALVLLFCISSTPIICMDRLDENDSHSKQLTPSRNKNQSNNNSELFPEKKRKNNSASPQKSKKLAPSIENSALFQLAALTEQISTEEHSIFTADLKNNVNAINKRRSLMYDEKKESDQVDLNNNGQLANNGQDTKLLRTQEFLCTKEGCDIILGSQGSLKNHIKFQHEKTEKDLSCPHEGCNYKTADKHHLKSHITYRHEKTEKDLSCLHEKCNYRSKYQSAINAHIKKKHPELHTS